MTSVAYVSKHFPFFGTDVLGWSVRLHFSAQPVICGYRWNPPPPPTWNIRKGYLLRLSCKLKVVPSFLCQGVNDEEKFFLTLPPGACTIKLYDCNLLVFASMHHLHLSLIFTWTELTIQVEPIIWLHSCRLLDLFPTFRLIQKLLAVTNTLAYNSALQTLKFYSTCPWYIMNSSSTPEAQSYRIFTAVIYKCL